MQLEARYTVLKNRDIQAYLTDEEQGQLDDLRRKINRLRLMEGKEILQGIMLEQDWPEYAPARASLEKRIQQEHCQHVWKWHQIAGEGQICSKCLSRNFDCDD